MYTHPGTSHSSTYPLDLSPGAKDTAPADGVGRLIINQSNKNRQCPKCGRKFTCSAHVRRHIDEVHLGLKREDKCKTCPICGQTFLQKIACRVHIQNAHGKNGKQLEQNSKKSTLKAQCSLCGKWYASRASLHRHIRLNHPNEQSVTPGSDHGHQMDISHLTHSREKTVGSLTGSASVTSSVAESVDIKKIYKCDDCDAAFPDEASLDKHEYSVHIQTKGRLWGQKEGATIQKQDTKASEEKSSIKNFPRTYSQIREQQKKRQRRRKETYTAADCTLCGKRFSTRGNMNKHLRTSCSHRIASAADTSDELKKEDQEMKLLQYKCNDCAETFCSESLRDKHEYSVHIQNKMRTGNKRDELINTHNRKATSQYPQCDIPLLNKPSREHKYQSDSRMGHNPVKQQKNGCAPKRRRKWLGVKCDFCGMQFFSKWGRNRHIQNSCSKKSSLPQCSLSELVCDEERSRKSVSGESSTETCTDDASKTACHTRTHNVNSAYLYKHTSNTKKVSLNSQQHVEKYNKENHQQTDSSFRSPHRHSSIVQKHKSLRVGVSESIPLRTQQRQHQRTDSSKGSSSKRSVHFPPLSIYDSNDEDGLNMFGVSNNDEDNVIVVDNSSNYTNAFCVEDWTYTCPKCKEDIMGSFSFVMHIKAHMDRRRDGE